MGCRARTVKPPARRPGAQTQEVRRRGTQRAATTRAPDPPPASGTGERRDSPHQMRGSGPPPRPPCRRPHRYIRKGGQGASSTGARGSALPPQG
eukprot:10503366-Alexandrium_andersonii.AAC.1